MAQLKTNTTDLQSILNKVNALPDAHKALETCTVIVGNYTSSNVKVHYLKVNANMQPEVTVLEIGEEFMDTSLENVCKNSIFFISDISVSSYETCLLEGDGYRILGGEDRLNDFTKFCLFSINGDCFIGMG